MKGKAYANALIVCDVHLITLEYHHAKVTVTPFQKSIQSQEWLACCCQYSAASGMHKSWLSSLWLVPAIFSIISCLSNSIFALATPEELEESLKKWRESIDNGTADQCIEKSEELRRMIGLTTSVVAYKP